MNISCHGCGRQFRVRQDKLPAQGARTRCPRCDEVLVIAPPRPETADESPAREVETQPPVAMKGELFDLPHTDLLAPEDELFALEGQDSSSQPAEPVPVVSQNAGAGMNEPAQQSGRAGGLRGWLARLFSRES
jgi:predicted Zn finger-like uncharacterized protein